jgi:UDP-N-acetylglucosamine 2-epimerase
MRTLLVVGTRPQIIKSASIIKESVNWPRVELQVVHTGQHYNYTMSREFFDELSLPEPVVNLNVGSGSHAWQTAQIMMGLEKVFTELDPDIVLIPGDTNSALAAALTAAKMLIPVAHIESGARSFDRRMPEEVNRVVIDHLSTILFASSQNCVKNLGKEGLPSSLVGDTMYESILDHLDEIRRRDIYHKLGLKKASYGVVTLHRAENVDNEAQLKSIINALNNLKMDLVFPCHPRTLVKMNQYSLRSTFKLINPLPYLDMLNLVSEASVLFTDSGGLQKEAYWLGTPCVTLRDSTEWVETLEFGANVLVGANPQKIRDEANRSRKKSIHGDGGSLFIPGASKSILHILNNWSAP